MFTINSTRPIQWPGFALTKGANEFTSRKSVPAELWPKLARFRSLGLIDFEGKAEAGKSEPHKLDELTEAQLYNFPKAELLELARVSGIAAADDSKKKDLLDALVAKLPKSEPEKAAEESKPQAPAKRGAPQSPPAAPVTVG